MTNLLPLALGAAVSDILASYASPVAALGGAGLSAVVAKLLRYRLDVAREILLEEVSRGEKTLHDLGEVDELAAITFRYARAAQEGTARLNLRLMAKVIAGQAQAGPLVADEFLAWADVLASLRREEVILLAEMVRVRADLQAHHPEEAPQQWLGKIRDVLAGRMIPSHFSSEDELAATELGLSRTGLVVGLIIYSGGPRHAPSPLMDELQALAPFQGALREEGINPEGTSTYP